MSKSSDHILEKAIIRCKKAQAITRPYNEGEVVRAGTLAAEKLEVLLEMSKEDDYGELGEQLLILDDMVKNMQLAIMEPLMDSLETIERRMNTYISTVSDDEVKSGDGMSVERSQTGESDEADGNQDLRQSADADSAAPDDVTVQQQRFFERLHHFFEVQRIAEEKMQLIDPSEKLGTIKLKPHSKGIQEKDGTFKAGYRQQDGNGKTIKYLSDLYAAAEEAKPAFQDVLNSLNNDLPQLNANSVQMAPIKDQARASEKAHEEYTYRIPGPREAWLYDILRASVTCKSQKQLSDVNKWLKENVHIVDCQNRFAMPQFDGYRDLLYYISVPYKEELAFVCEIQVHHFDFKQRFGVNSHRPYFRPYFSGPWREPFENLRDLDMLLQVGRVDDNLMEFLLEANDSSQLKLFGRLFLEKLEETDRALELFKRVLTVEETALGKGHVITGTTYQYLGLSLLKKGDSDSALMYLREALTVSDANLGSAHPEIAMIHSQIGDALLMKGDYGQSLIEQTETLSIRESSLGENHLLVADSYLKVAAVLLEQGDYKKALAESRTALTIQESILGDSTAEVAQTQLSIGAILEKQGEDQKAEEMHLSALSIFEKSYGRKHEKVAEALSQVGALQAKKGQFDEALSSHHRALEIRESLFGKSHPECANSHTNIAVVLDKTKDAELAVASLRLALGIRGKSLGRYHLETSNSHFDIGSLLLSNGDPENAMGQFKECLTIRKSLCGRNHPLVAQAMNAVGRSKAELGRLDKAFSDHEKALVILEKVVGPNHPWIADTYQYFGEIQNLKGEKDKAFESHSKALGLRSELLGKHHPETATSCLLIAKLLESKGDLQGAKVAYRQALSSYLVLHGEDSQATAQVRVCLGRMMVGQLNFEGAEEELAKANAVLEGNDDLLAAESQSLLGTVLSKREDYDGALELHEKALKIRREQNGDQHPDTADSASKVNCARNKVDEDEITV
ncbi:MAG: hypothetical protein SGBAC_006956 [Bacillariaceae sp.]